MTNPAPHAAALAEAMTAYRQDRFDEAESLLTRHLSAVPGDAVAIRWMIRLLTRLGRGGEALSYIRQLQSILEQSGGEHTGTAPSGPREEGALAQQLQQRLANRYREWDEATLQGVVATVMEVLAGGEESPSKSAPSGRKRRLMHQLSRLERAAEALAQRRQGEVS